MSGYKNKSKEVTCLCIIQAVRLKAVREAMYFHHKDGSEADDDDDCTSDNAGNMVLASKEEDGNDEDIVAVGENEIINVLQSKKRKKRKSKSSTPDSLSKSGTYYRVINAFMADVNRPFVVNIGSNPTMAALDSRQFLHKAIYDILLLSYNDTTNNVINDFAFPEEIYFEQAGVSIDVASEFDVLTSKDFSDVMGYLNFHYQVAHRKNKSSGSHGDFANFVGTCPYLLYYHLWLDQVPCLQNLAVPTLPSNVMRDSLAPRSFPLASETSTNEIAGSANKTAVLSLLVAEIGKGNVERTTIMKERNAQSEKMLNIAAVRHAVRTEMDLSKLLLMHKKSLSDACQELKTLQGTEGYTSDSSETKDAKNYICVLSDRYNNTMRSLENHSA